MRNYRSRYVRQRILLGRADAVCPFPGKHPLRLTWRIHSKSQPDLNAFYYGKFTTAAWKQLSDLTNAAYAVQTFDLISRFSLFDRNGELASGAPFDMRGMNAIHKMRYFPFEGNRLRDALKTAEPRACGPYWIYSTEPIDALDIAVAVRNIQTVIPVLRNR